MTTCDKCGCVILNGLCQMCSTPQDTSSNSPSIKRLALEHNVCLAVPSSTLETLAAHGGVKRLLELLSSHYYVPHIDDCNCARCTETRDLLRACGREA